VFGAIRLARFNVTTNENDPKYFIGLPIPTDAVVLGSWVMLDVKYSSNIDVIILIGALILGFLMVSNFRYPSFKKINLDKKVALKVLVLIILVSSFIYLYPIEAIAIILSIYVFYGFTRGIINYLKIIKKVNG